MFVALGTVSSLCVMSIDYRLLSRYSKVLVLLALFLLLLLHVPGMTGDFGPRDGFVYSDSAFSLPGILQPGGDYLYRFFSADKGLKRVEYFSFSFTPTMIVLAMVSVLVFPAGFRGRWWL